jgi:hypothetical protein
MRYLQGYWPHRARTRPILGSEARYRTSTLDDEEMIEILTSLKRRRAVAAEGGDGVLVSILDEVIAELEAGNLPGALRSDE